MFGRSKSTDDENVESPAVENDPSLEREKDPPRLRDALPVATRPNKLAMILAGGGIGITLLIIFFSMIDFSGPSSNQDPVVEPGRVQMPTTTRPQFLDQVQEDDEHRDGGLIGSPSGRVPPPVVRPDQMGLSGQGPQMPGAPPGDVVGADGRPYSEVSSGDPSVAYGQSTVEGGYQGGQQQQVDPRRQAFESALRASAVSSFSSRGGAAQGGSQESTSGPSRDMTFDEFAVREQASEREAMERVQALAASQGMNVDGTPIGSSPGNPNDRNERFRSNAARGQYRASVVSDVGNRGTQQSRTSRVAVQKIVRAGTIIPANLISAINSDIPGDIVAQVSRNVYDFEMRNVVIPQGSRLIGSYNSRVAVGQDRIVVAWTILQLPDGRSIELPDFPIADETGATGVRDRVDNHYRRVFGNAILMSLISAGFNSGESVPVDDRQMTPRQRAQAQAQAELNQVATQVLQRNLAIQPTIRIRSGFAFTVFLGQDLVLPD
jgi:type IV secretion system protein TrbI